MKVNTTHENIHCPHCNQSIMVTVALRQHKNGYDFHITCSNEKCDTKSNHIDIINELYKKNLRIK